MTERLHNFSLLKAKNQKLLKLNCSKIEAS